MQNAKPGASPLERERRHRVLNRATIIQDINTSEIGCTVRNQSPVGVELIVPIEAVVPTTFTLYIPVDNKAYDAEIRWRRNDRMGVRLLLEKPKPRLGGFRARGVTSATGFVFCSAH
jgi:hypothetical protein